MIKILHYLKDPELWELWHIPYSGQCRIYIIKCIFGQLSKVGFLLHSFLQGCRTRLKTEKGTLILRTTQIELAK